MKVTIEKEFDYCYHACPHFTLEGGPSPLMVCAHPDAEDDGYIISHPQCQTGFPDKCPLLNPSEIKFGAMTQWPTGVSRHIALHTASKTETWEQEE